eukprot:CAMPEP_0177767542 /NCGR_PEP_ID=MMETSP0491_2-20121128/9182_1 /TAXON_ID=63592 /ORGANISM="Tetraselmis chuii, Strain PLY429" /LENGTH=234 /DNA_ID=CAMNT_0019284167 /DNA_START=273 /DNA_END=974 /DNA_ORIENTATION=+
MGATISKRAQRQSWEARAVGAERALHEAQERLMRVESEQRLELQAQEGQQRHASAGSDLQRGTSGCPEQAHVAGAERAENREIPENRPMPPHHLLRTQPEESPTTQGDAVAMGAEGTMEVRPELAANIHTVGEGYTTHQVPTQNKVRASGEAKSAPDTPSTSCCSVSDGQSFEFDAFLSHNWGADKKAHAKVVLISNLLMSAGVRVWLDETCLKDHIKTSVLKGIDSSRFVVAF